MTATSEPLTAPTWPVLIAVAASLASIGIAVSNAVRTEAISIPLALTGYVLGAIVCTIAAASYRALRNSRRADPRFRVRNGWDRLSAATMWVGVAAGLVNAYLLATELAK